MNRILVTGATGHLGRLAIEALLKTPGNHSISALVRDAEKAADLKKNGVELRTGNYDNAASLEAAFKGIDKLLFISASDLMTREKQHENVIEAAKKSGIKKILYTSFQRKNETETSPIAFVTRAHLLTEKWIKESGIDYTILANTLYTDMIPVFIGENVIENGTVFLPAGNGKTAYATRQDMAEAMAKILVSENHRNSVLNFANTEAVSMEEIAGILSEIGDKEVNYVSPSKDEFTKQMKEWGAPDQGIQVVSAFSEAITQGEFEQTSSDLKNILGRQPQSVKEYLQTVYPKETVLH